MGATYQLLYRNAKGQLYGTIDFASINFARKENEVGWLTANIKPIFLPGDIDPDGTLEVWRSVNGASPYMELTTPWWIRKIRFYTDTNGVDGIELTAHDTIGLIDRRIVAYDSGTVYSEKADNADNLVKAIMRENFGNLAFDTSRDLSSILTIQHDSNQGSADEKSCSWSKCLSIMQEIAKESDRSGLRIIFDLIQLANGNFEFRTFAKYRGIDHSSTSINPVMISKENGSLSAPELIYDYTQEVNVAYAGGQNVGTNRVVQVSQDNVRIGMSPWNRMEAFVDARNSINSSAVLTEARYAVIVGQPRLYFNGVLLQTPNNLYGIHYGYGDLITASYKGKYFNCRVDSIQIKVDNNGEEIVCSLRGDYALGQGYNVT